MDDIEAMVALLRHVHSIVHEADRTSNLDHTLHRVVTALHAADGYRADGLTVEVLNYKGRVMNSASVGRVPADSRPATKLVVVPEPAGCKIVRLRWSLALQDEVIDQTRRPGDHPADAAALMVVVDHVSPVIAAAVEVLSMREALNNRDTFGTAKGMLMERNGIDAAAAFTLISRLSQATNTKAVDIAHRVIAAGTARN